ncbi:fatty acid--CoA ligase family protein [Bradyrhizobium sp. LHD-71]|uniref:class I adenylate-forming enzyme family protein n=1 Tax=Bradyrhizobium sp. LHD-71 TaxID=3072141 RepID=UPI00280C840A|nr:fatty acid--CoA ligase family protein [Bradyrhizobium sp. LHD-71]MDQ8728262.1 fatty acid--CoA ligase family protein [Bradyrhizobium sp. LHD-71]
MSKLGEFVRSVTQIDRSAPAIEFKGNWTSWGDIAATMDGIDAALLLAGLGPGIRVGGLLRNDPRIAASILGVIASERCVVTLNPLLPDERLSADVLQLRPPALFVTPEDVRRPGLLAAATEIGCLVLQLTGVAANPVRPLDGFDSIAAEDLHIPAQGVGIEMMSSGTTGTPKRIPLATRTLEDAVFGAAVFEKRSAEDPPKLRRGVQILNAPFAHISGIFGLLNCIVAGRSSVLLERFSVAEFVDAIRRHRPNVASAPPSAMRMILEANVDKGDFSSLAAFRCGTAPLPPELADAFYERFGIPVLQNYGATEFAGGVAGWTIADHRNHYKDKRGSVGRMNPDCEGRVVDPDTGAVLDSGQEGLLELRAKHLGDGKSWIRTTDLAVLDAERFLWIKGRFDNAIIRGGFKVFPDDIVRALEAHPAVREAAVVALPDARLGQVPVAAYIAKSNAGALDPDGLRAFLRERLLPYQVPVEIREVADLPRTPSLKVSQPELRKLFEVRTA